MAYRHILVPIDGSEISFKTLKEAIELAKQYQSKITVFYVIPKGGEFVDLFDLKTVKKAFEEEGKKIFDKARDIANQEKISLSFRTAEGKPFEKIIETAKMLGCDLIVMGSHGKGSIEKFFLGSCTERVLKEAPCPVLVVRD